MDRWTCPTCLHTEVIDDGSDEYTAVAIADAQIKHCKAHKAAGITPVQIRSTRARRPARRLGMAS
jgi:hypothetical protein